MRASVDEDVMYKVGRNEDRLSPRLNSSYIPVHMQIIFTPSQTIEVNIQ